MACATIDLDNGLVTNLQQVISWTNEGQWSQMAPLVVIIKPQVLGTCAL